jgi:hypothetical protein
MDIKRLLAVSAINQPPVLKVNSTEHTFYDYNDANKILERGLENKNHDK